MVYFNKLRVTGFKSFVDPTELLIEPGLTGIVGPNGCGKSNLVEALRWAMGETSAKRLRGGEMDDVIFGGSANRPARNIAEVTLSLDNAGRDVPAQFNEHQAIEVIRRIERGSGSSYRVNGREVRARDVQLLFADAATGAHSTALVSQGRVGAIINAKPTDRRALLEEAAGITGLHSRRHEAELRLRAAEANLARLDDVIVTLESQLQALKKQARQAARYRKLNEKLRRTEAILLHLEWVESQVRRDGAGKAHAEAESAVARLTGEAAAAATVQAEAAAALPPLRHGEVEAAAELQRLELARHALDQDEARTAAAIAAAMQALAQLDEDIRRETTLAEDAAVAQRRLAAEAEDLIGRAAGAEDEAAEADRAVGAAQSEVDETEQLLATATERLAAVEARAAALRRRLGEIEARQARLGRRMAQVASERERAAAATAQAERETERHSETATAATALASAQQAAAIADQARAAAAAAEAKARESLQEAQARHGRVAAEIEALAALFKASGSDLWPPLIDSLGVAPGYEAALAAALGDDLAASADSGAPVHWETPAEDRAAPGLPAGSEPLSRHVQGPAALARRLAQIGVVADEAAGSRLRGMLVQGQRLVSRDGAMWRWDGYTIRSGTESAPAIRLKQRNRMKQLSPLLAEAEANLASAAERHRSIQDAAQKAAAEDRAGRQAVGQAFEALARARAAETAAVQRLDKARSQLAALDQVAAGLSEDEREANAETAAAETERAALPDIAAGRAAATELRSLLAEQRTTLIECRSRRDRLQREAESRRERLAAVASERQSWQDRAAAAALRLDAFAARRSAAETEHARLSRRPEEIARQRAALLDSIESAAVRRRAAADRLAEAETRLAMADRSLKAAEATLGEAREDRVRAEAGVAQAAEAGAALAQRIREHLACAPEEALEVAGVEPGDALPDREATAQRLGRLQRERDAVGPVNLRAESEAGELDQQIAGLQSERSDLVAAISRLRQGIASLNREGRERLLAAFELVNGHFGTLFTRLFGGGRAHLALTEAEDPLEAGLEIMASPPGKRLQVMSLLSGGEQALTALALLFGVFLTNPAPICVLDEVDAPLDDANVDRFCTLVEELAHSSATRFLLITHHRMTMARMDRLYGVTMAERGISQLVSVDLQAAEELRATG